MATKKKPPRLKGKKKAKRKSRAKKTKSKKSPSRKRDRKLPNPGAGRRTTLTPEVQDCLVDVVQAGNYYVTACHYCQIPESTLYSWMKRGEAELERIISKQEKTGKAEKPLQKENVYLEFLEAIKNADAKAEVSAVIKVRQDKDWKAHMTWLERRFSSRWKRKDRYELTGADGKDLVPVHIYIPDNGRDKK